MQGIFSAWTILDCSLRRVAHFVGCVSVLPKVLVSHDLSHAGTCSLQGGDYTFPHDDDVYECEIWHAPFLFPAAMEQALYVAVVLFGGGVLYRSVPKTLNLVQVPGFHGDPSIWWYL